MPTAPDTRQKLLDAAMELFVFQGYGATGLAQIARRAGVLPGSLYYFFPSKEDLLLATLEERKRTLYEGVLQPIWESTADPIERVRKGEAPASVSAKWTADEARWRRLRAKYLIYR